MESAPFLCSICSESSQDICVYCTKDACRNHLCERCKRCSDCCDCEFRVSEVTHSAEHLLANGESRYAKPPLMTAPDDNLSGEIGDSVLDPA